MTPRTRPARRSRSGGGRAPRTSPELIAELAFRLTDRDRQILRLVWEHRVLTTQQLAALRFPSLVRTQQRLRVLHRWQALLRFQPWVPVGTAALHWVLGPAGAHVLAVEDGISIRELGYRQDTALDIAVSSKLGHQVGVNDFFARLHAYARHRDDGTQLQQWTPERRCASLDGGRVRPDAYGRWSETVLGRGPASVEFFLEHDNGTETLARVAAKLHGYAAHARTTGHLTPVLFWLPSPTREANLRRLLTDPPVPVATAVHTPDTALEGPAGAVWFPAGVTAPRRRLADLANAWEFTDPEPARDGDQFTRDT
ncbi:replication-relaxation family protein [Actinomadura barringtoniae]|uniref:Replication-relaxation family protein n=1 Tax=Actinomadura barringtoniae TaxID=1427535 RepID=A0A939PSM4_9ACTN|nr:replication-relaxation family protein [Actinomadura barringtoniae]MBO2454354.1 replication-relaxation family protein [Actinomadura barringtoniae]